MQKKLHLKGLVKSNKEGILEASVASSEIVDRMGEVVKIDGIGLKNFKKNPVLLWSHNSGLTDSRPPIGKVLKTWVDGVRKKRLMFSVQFDLSDPFAKMISDKYKNGFLNAFSIGFQPLEKEDNVFIESELLEISAVPIPANPEALSILRSADLIPKTWEVFFKETKTAVPFKETPPAPEGLSWNGAKARKNIKKWATDGDKLKVSKFKQGFGWFDSESKEKIGSYKLPHHDIVGGVLKTHWRGVASAMAALLGARSGADIPESERKTVYRHLVKHYKQFDKEAPEFRSLEDMKETLDAIIPKVKKKGLEKTLRKVVKEELKVKKTKVTDNNILPNLEDALKIVATATNIALRKINKGKGGEKNKN